MITTNYLEKLYAGILGKIIGVYLGRPFEGWTYNQIVEKFGEIKHYVNDQVNLPLIVTDDDISGTFTFIRAVEDYGYRFDTSAEQIGNTWLNYLIENKTVLWWGGLGNSTEHTAYLRLKNGIKAPQSGSMNTNGKVVAEQIGAQIFIDGWAMICPGDPEKAVHLAKEAASVSHDGEGIYGAQIIAALEAQAFIEENIQSLLDIATSFIPKDSIIYKLIQDLREWHEKEPDWKKTRALIEAYYGYDRYGGNCHIVPNHALIHLGLLYGDNDFQKSLMITNTSGWDTDCNSGNIGCIMGIKNGLDGLDQGADWRRPVADRMLLPTADAGRAITDAVKETYNLYNTCMKMNHLHPIFPKQNARFHFELPDSLQGFHVDPECGVLLRNIEGHSLLGKRCLSIEFDQSHGIQDVKVRTPTFIQPEELNMPGYTLTASPTIYPGQVIQARVESDPENTKDLTLRLFIKAYLEDDNLIEYYGPETILRPGNDGNLQWELDNPYQFSNISITEVGINIQSDTPVTGHIYLDYLTWDGPPKVIFKKPLTNGNAWKKSWVDAVDYFETNTDTFRLIQNEGRGLLIYGCQDWKNYQINADVTPHMARNAGIAARFQGLLRYYALLLSADGKVRLIKMKEHEIILAERDQGWRFGEGANLSMKVDMNRISCYWDGFLIFDIVDNEEPLLSGSIALIIDEGRTATQGVSIFPI